MFPEVFHIGTLKTGSTTLQNILSQDERLNVVIHSRSFNVGSETPSSYPYFENGKLNIETDENICRKYGGMVGLEESLNRIKRVNPNASIVFFCREQRAAIKSMYKHHVRQTGQPLSLREFLQDDSGKTYVDTLRYNDVWNIIKRYFESERIHFFLFEEFIRSPKEFMAFFYKEALKMETSPTFNATIPKDNKGLSDSEVLRYVSFLKVFPPMLRCNNNVRRIAWFQVRMRRKLPLSFVRSSATIPIEEVCKETGLIEEFAVRNSSIVKATGLPLEKNGYLLKE